VLGRPAGRESEIGVAGARVSDFLPMRPPPPSTACVWMLYCERLMNCPGRDRRSAGSSSSSTPLMEPNKINNTLRESQSGSTEKTQFSPLDAIN